MSKKDEFVSYLELMPIVEAARENIKWGYSDTYVRETQRLVFAAACKAFELDLSEDEARTEILKWCKLSTTEETAARHLAWCETTSSKRHPLVDSEVQRQVQAAYELNTKIEVSSTGEVNQVAELDRAYKTKARALMDYFGLSYREDKDQAQQLWRLVIALAQRDFPGFQLSRKGEAHNKKTDGIPGWKLYCVVQTAIKETGWTQDKVIEALFNAVPPEHINWDKVEDPDLYEPTPRCLLYYPEFSKPSFKTASALKRRFFEAQKDLKARFEARTNKNNDATFEDFVDVLMTQLKWAPEFFETADPIKSYERLAIFTKL